MLPHILLDRSLTALRVHSRHGSRFASRRERYRLGRSSGAADSAQEGPGAAAGGPKAGADGKRLLNYMELDTKRQFNRTNYPMMSGQENFMIQPQARNGYYGLESDFYY